MLPTRERKIGSLVDDVISDIANTKRLSIPDFLSDSNTLASIKTRIEKDFKAKTAYILQKEMEILDKMAVKLRKKIKELEDEIPSDPKALEKKYGKDTNAITLVMAFTKESELYQQFKSAKKEFNKFAKQVSNIEKCESDKPIEGDNNDAIEF